MKKQGKKWMLVVLALLAVVALPLVGCKNDSVSGQSGGNTEQPATPGTTGGNTEQPATPGTTGDNTEQPATLGTTGSGNQEGEIPKNITDTVGGINFTMVGVPGGTVTGSGTAGVFIAGRTVTLSDFYIGKYEVTQEEYASVMANQKVKVNGTEHTLNANPSEFQGDSKPPAEGEDPDQRPVENVSWYDAVWYCNALSEKAGLEKAYDITVKWLEISGGNEQGEIVYSISTADVELVPEANGYRLPTEAEWEYAARGGKPKAAEWKYPYAGTNNWDELKDYAWYSDNSSSKTYEVGKKKENSLGLYDMSGNVFEWCWDWFDFDPKVEDGGSTSVTDPTGPETEPMSGFGRVRRGGSWYYDYDNCSVSFRGRDNPDYRDYSLGFRVVRTGEGTGTGDGNGEAPKPTSVSFTDSSGKTQTFTMVSVPGGTVTGFGSDGVFVEGRTVELSAFEIGKHEVTQELYEAVMTGQTVTWGRTEYTLNATPSDSTGDNLPVEQVSWYDAVYFCNALSEKLNLTPAYTITDIEVNRYDSIPSATVGLVEGANGYRLPTEAEWEYAARGGNPSTEETAPWSYTYAGGNTIGDVAWYIYNSEKKIHQVGTKAENRLGIHDMSGNVYEWCWDRDGSIKADTPPTGPSAGSSRIDRGGSWNNGAISCGVSDRHYNNPSSRFKDVGFRVVRPAK